MEHRGQAELPVGFATEYAVEKTDVERTVYDWAIPEFRDVFEDLNQKQVPRAIANRQTGNGKEKHVSSSELELVSEEFFRGQLVQRTSKWQLEMRRNGAHLTVGLSCLECFHENIDEIWTRFDVDIVDFNGDVLYSQSAGTHFSTENLTKFTPAPKVGSNKDARVAVRCSFWETDVISMIDLKKNWSNLVRMDILALKLRLYIYREKPFDEASHFAEYHEPVKICYTDVNDKLPTSNLLTAAFKNLWQSKEDVDVTFSVNGEEVTAHKLVLSAVSPVFKDLISQHEDDSPIEMKVPSVQAFVQVLKYVYTQDSAELKTSHDIKHITNVVDVCNEFGILALSRICFVRLLEMMTIENFAEIAFAVFSKVQQEHSFFKTEVKKFLMENQRLIQANEAFQKAARVQKEVFLQLCFEPLVIYRNIAGNSTGTSQNI